MKGNALEALRYIAESDGSLPEWVAGYIPGLLKTGHLRNLGWDEQVGRLVGLTPYGLKALEVMLGPKLSSPFWSKPTPPDQEVPCDHVSADTPFGMMHIHWSEKGKLKDRGYVAQFPPDWNTSPIAIKGSLEEAKVYCESKYFGLLSQAGVKAIKE